MHGEREGVPACCQLVALRQARMMSGCNGQRSDDGSDVQAMEACIGAMLRLLAMSVGDWPQQQSHSLPRGQQKEGDRWIIELPEHLHRDCVVGPLQDR